LWILNGISIRVARWFVFTPKIPILGKFWRALDWKMLIYYVYGHLEYLWDIFRPFDTFCIHLVHFSGFGIMYQEKKLATLISMAELLRSQNFFPSSKKLF
jgi:hypothetical protein